MHHVRRQSDRHRRHRLAQVGDGHAHPRSQRDRCNGQGPGRGVHAVGHREVNRGDGSDCVGDGRGEHHPAGRVQEPGAVSEQPEIAVGVAPEHVLGRDPDVAGGEHPAFDRGGGVDRSPRPGQQDTDLFGSGDLHEATLILQNQVFSHVVGAQLDLAAAGQWATLAANLGPGHVGEHGLPVGGGEKLHDRRGLEDLQQASPQSGRQTRPHEQPDRIVSGQGILTGGDEAGIFDDLPQHRPGIGHHGDAVLADLIEEPVRPQTPGQCDSCAGHHRTAQADQ